MITKRDIVEMGRHGLLKEVELLEDLSFSLETSPPRHAHWTKRTISKDSDIYELLKFLSQAAKPGDTVNIIRLAFDKQSRLYSIPKEIYDENEPIIDDDDDD